MIAKKNKVVSGRHEGKSIKIINSVPHILSAGTSIPLDESRVGFYDCLDDPETVKPCIMQIMLKSGEDFMIEVEGDVLVAILQTNKAMADLQKEELTDLLILSAAFSKGMKSQVANRRKEIVSTDNRDCIQEEKTEWVSEMENYQAKKRVIVVLVAIFILGGLLAFYFFIAPRLSVGKFSDALKEGDYESAVTIYETYQNRSSFIEDAVPTLNAYLNNVIGEYSQTGDEQAFDKANEIIQCAQTSATLYKLATQYDESLQKIKASKNGYQQAILAIQNKDFINTHENLLLAYKKDINYGSMQELLAKYEKDIISAYVNAGKKLSNDGKYEEALALLNRATISFAEKDLRDTIASIEVHKMEQAEKIKQAALHRMRIVTDEIEKVTWYYDKSSPQYVNRNGFFIYIGKSETNKWMRLKVQYTGDDWLFINKYIINVDGNNYSIPVVSYSDVVRDNDGGKVWEYIDLQYGPTLETIGDAVANSEKTIIRYHGDTWYYDREITSSEKQAIKNVLAAYNVL